MKIGNLVGLVGWRGMVGSVLMERMQAEGDFGLIEPVFFSTSNAGGAAPSQAKNETRLQDAHDINALKRCDIIISAQGGDYTTEIFPRLRAAGWNQCSSERRSPASAPTRLTRMISPPGLSTRANSSSARSGRGTAVVLLPRGSLARLGIR